MTVFISPITPKTAPAILGAPSLALEHINEKLCALIFSGLNKYEIHTAARVCKSWEYIFRKISQRNELCIAQQIMSLAATHLYFTPMPNYTPSLSLFFGKTLKTVECTIAHQAVKAPLSQRIELRSAALALTDDKVRSSLLCILSLVDLCDNIPPNEAGLKSFTMLVDFLCSNGRFLDLRIFLKKFAEKVQVANIAVMPTESEQKQMSIRDQMVRVSQETHDNYLLASLSTNFKAGRIDHALIQKQNLLLPYSHDSFNMFVAIHYLAIKNYACFEEVFNTIPDSKNKDVLFKERVCEFLDSDSFEIVQGLLNKAPKGLDIDELNVEYASRLISKKFYPKAEEVLSKVDSSKKNICVLKLASVYVENEDVCNAVRVAFTCSSETKLKYWITIMTEHYLRDNNRLKALSLICCIPNPVIKEFATNHYNSTIKPNLNP